MLASLVLEIIMIFTSMITNLAESVGSSCRGQNPSCTPHKEEKGAFLFLYCSKVSQGGRDTTLFSQLCASRVYGLSSHYQKKNYFATKLLQQKDIIVARNIYIYICLYYFLLQQGLKHTFILHQYFICCNILQKLCCKRLIPLAFKLLQYFFIQIKYF